MWRSLWAVLLGVMVAQGQVGTQSPAVRPPAPVEATAENREWMHVFPEHSEWRRGTEEKILLIPQLDPTSPILPVY